MLIHLFKKKLTSIAPVHFDLGDTMLCWLVDMGEGVYVCVVCLQMCIIHICVLQAVCM